MWPYIVVPALVALAALHWFWQRRWRQSQARCQQLEQALAVAAAEKRELSLQEQARRQTIFDGMIEGIALLDPQGRIEFMNLALRRCARFSSSAPYSWLMKSIRVMSIFANS